MVPAEMAARHNFRTVIVVGAAVAFFLVLVYAGLTNKSSQHKSTHEITYRTGGSARMGDVTYAAPSGTSQASNARLPFMIGYTMSRGDFAYVSVQNGENAGTVSCEIVMDGRVVVSNSSSGGYAIATCNGRLP